MTQAATIDIETKTFGSPDPTQDELVLIGIKPLGGESRIFQYPKDFDAAREELRKYRVLIGYNINDYDIPILQRYGINLKRFTSCDLLRVIRNRENYFGVEFPDKSLSTVLQVLDLPNKLELPIHLFNKDPNTWSPAEEEIATTYLKNDLFIEEALFYYLDKYFHDWKDWLTAYDVSEMKHLTSSDGVFTYKAICKLTGMKEEYNEYIPKEERDSALTGGLVVEPNGSAYHGRILCLDFNSMYPHAYIQGNLYSHSCHCCSKDEKWRGDSLFPVRGAYCTKRRGIIEEALRRLYSLRLEYKKTKDQRQYAIKIMINTIYGISGSPAFKNVYNLNTANDCTMIGRTCLKYARDRLAEEGYIIIYSDTDSAYIQDPFDDMERIVITKTRIVDELKKHFPHPVDTFNIGIEEPIEHIWFFKKEGKLKKKHYAYVTTKGDVVIKGLPIIKRDCSSLGTKLLDEVIRPTLQTGTLRLPKKQWDDLITKTLQENINLAGKHFYLKGPLLYKDKNCLPALLATKYGSGKHFLLPNKRYGVGKSTRYCTIQEFESQKLTISDLILNKTYGELEEFTEEPWQKSVVKPLSSNQRRKKNPQSSLFDFGKD